jgi:hypothetical protein
MSGFPMPGPSAVDTLRRLLQQHSAQRPVDVGRLPPLTPTDRSTLATLAGRATALSGEQRGVVGAALVWFGVHHLREHGATRQTWHTILEPLNVDPEAQRFLRGCIDLGLFRWFGLTVLKIGHRQRYLGTMWAMSGALDDLHAALADARERIPARAWASANLLADALENHASSLVPSALAARLEDPEIAAACAERLFAGPRPDAQEVVPPDPDWEFRLARGVRTSRLHLVIPSPLPIAATDRPIVSLRIGATRVAARRSEASFLPMAPSAPFPPGAADVDVLLEPAEGAADEPTTLWTVSFPSEAAAVFIDGARVDHAGPRTHVIIVLNPTMRLEHAPAGFSPTAVEGFTALSGVIGDDRRFVLSSGPGAAPTPWSIPAEPSPRPRLLGGIAQGRVPNVRIGRGTVWRSHPTIVPAAPSTPAHLCPNSRTFGLYRAQIGNGRVYWGLVSRSWRLRLTRSPDGVHPEAVGGAAGPTPCFTEALAAGPAVIPLMWPLDANVASGAWVTTVHTTGAHLVDAWTGEAMDTAAPLSIDDADVLLTGLPDEDVQWSSTNPGAVGASGKRTLNGEGSARVPLSEVALPLLRGAVAHVDLRVTWMGAHAPPPTSLSIRPRSRRPWNSTGRDIWIPWRHPTRPTVLALAASRFSDGLYALPVLGFGSDRWLVDLPFPDRWWLRAFSDDGATGEATALGAPTILGEPDRSTATDVLSDAWRRLVHETNRPNAEHFEFQVRESGLDLRDLDDALCLLVEDPRLLEPWVFGRGLARIAAARRGESTAVTRLAARLGLGPMVRDTDLRGAVWAAPDPELAGREIATLLAGGFRGAVGRALAAHPNVDGEALAAFLEPNPGPPPDDLPDRPPWDDDDTDLPPPWRALLPPPGYDRALAALAARLMRWRGGSTLQAAEITLIREAMTRYRVRFVKWLDYLAGAAPGDA